MGCPYKRCGCGRTFTPREWLDLPSVGVQVTFDDEARYSLELRNCSCGSTIGIETVERLKEPVGLRPVISPSQS